MKAKVIFIGKKQKQIFFLKKWQTKKSSFFSSANSKYFFAKNSWIGPWVHEIN